MTTKVIATSLIEGISSVIKGKPEQIELFVTAFLAGGHVLIEDVPGLGKTTLAKTLARLVCADSGPDSSIFKRIQFTPDLLPYDITGVDIFNPKTQSFDFVPGPVFCDILLADEINRTTPKVQSALLEVMAERQVTSNGTTHHINPRFFVVATQNPVESEGTYPLPAAQLDRFMVRLSLGYPDKEAELAIMHEDPAETVLPGLKPVITGQSIAETQKLLPSVYCHPALEAAALSIVRETRTHPAVQLGASPRAALHLIHAARTLALVRGRNWIEDNDIDDIAVPVLSHRLIGKKHQTDTAAIVRGLTTDALKTLDRKTDWTRAPTDRHAD
jgi:MoxR-like ATPase